MIHAHSTRTWLSLGVRAALAIMLAVSPLALGQVSDVYLVSSFANNGNTYNASQPIYIVNPGGDTEGASVCAAIYVFDNSQEMLECCSCPISNNGLLTLTVKDVSSNTIIAIVPKSGVIKIVSSSQDGPCDATAALNPEPRLRAWMVNLQVATIPPPIIFFPPQGNSTPSPMLSVSAFDQSPLSAAEQSFLPQACSFVQFLGTGRGKCSCPAGG